MLNNFYVYAILDPRKPTHGNFSHEPIYVGYGTLDRMHQHDENSPNLILRKKLKRIKDQGLSPIRLKIKENLDQPTATELEKHLISEIGKIVDRTGPLCNIADGGEGGNTLRNHPKKNEIFRKIVEKKKLNKTGQFSKEWGSWLIGRTFAHTEETKLKISENHADISGEKNPMWGKKHSEETRDKMKIAKQKFLTSDEARDFFRRVSEGNNLRGKTYVEVYGEEKAAKLKQTRSEQMKKIREESCRNSWVTEISTGKHKRVAAEEVDSYLLNGYVKGRKTNLS